MKLSDLKMGESCRVVSVDGDDSIARRLMEMGVIPGTLIRVVKSAPLGDPIEIEVRGYHLAIRKTAATSIEVVQ
jgi:Fe2+ transport system protein FeoA